MLSFTWLTTKDWIHSISRETVTGSPVIVDVTVGVVPIAQGQTWFHTECILTGFIQRAVFVTLAPKSN